MVIGCLTTIGEDSGQAFREASDDCLPVTNENRKIK